MAGVTSGEILTTILRDAEAKGWKGADPYDGLSSRVGALTLPFGAFPRFALSQAVLRSPLARRIANPPHTENPKGLALFLGAAVRGRDVLGRARADTLCDSLRVRLFDRSIESPGGRGWGYPFPWQSRSFWAPAETPNTVATATAAWQLLEAGEAIYDLRAIALGLSAALFLSREFHFTPVGNGAAISYTANDRTRVVNLSALAARLFGRVARGQAHSRWRELADQLTEFVLGAQRADGSWPYSIDRGGDWEDSFHTGFILESLLDLRQAGAAVPSETIERGFEAYRRFFHPDGAALLYPKADSPLDAHSAAQGIVTFARLHTDEGTPAIRRDWARTMALAIADWARDSLWLPAKSRFAYRIQGGRRDERDYTRWVQAWMAYAMATASRLEGAASAQETAQWAAAQ